MFDRCNRSSSTENEYFNLIQRTKKQQSNVKSERWWSVLHICIELFVLGYHRWIKCPEIEQWRSSTLEKSERQRENVSLDINRIRSKSHACLLFGDRNEKEKDVGKLTNRSRSTLIDTRPRDGTSIGVVRFFFVDLLLRDTSSRIVGETRSLIRRWRTIGHLRSI